MAVMSEVMKFQRNLINFFLFSSVMGGGIRDKG